MSPGATQNPRPRSSLSPSKAIGSEGNKKGAASQAGRREARGAWGGVSQGPGGEVL